MMTARDLSPSQRAILEAQVCRQLRYLNRLIERMTRRGFDPTDPVWLAALQAKDVMLNLRMKLHYADCNCGVG